MKYITILSICSFFIVGVSSVYAAPTGRPPVFETKAAQRQDTVMSRLKTRADNEITRRVNALTKLLSQINEMKRLTSEQKTSLTSQVQNEITALTTLKTKIDADTDLATLRIDVQSIVKSYRIYALYIPKIYIIVHADRLLSLVEDMTLLQTKLQTRITALKGEGKDTAQMESLISDMTTKLADAKTQAQTAIDTVTPLTPEGFPDNKATLVSARTLLQTAHKDLRDAHKDAQQIRQGLVKLGVNVNAKITPVGPTPTPASP